MFDRRRFIVCSCSISLGCVFPGWFSAARVSHIQNPGYVMTVRGKLSINQLGVVLPHEHVITDFSGAEKVNSLNTTKQRHLKLCCLI
jgi:hypothetical protein